MAQDDLAPVVRLYERLAEALQRTRRDPFNVPVTVAEIYQELVPYRLVRSEIGFDMNADYEHALLRLLAGEGERVRMEPGHAVDELRRELRAANPNLSMYRDYAACDVWVTKPAAPATIGSMAPMPAPKVAAPAPAKQTARAESARAKRPEHDTQAEPAIQATVSEPTETIESIPTARRQAEVATPPKTYAPGDATIGPFKLADSEQADRREEDDEQPPGPAMDTMSDAKKQTAAAPAAAVAPSVPSPEPSTRAARPRAAAEAAVPTPAARPDAGLTAATPRCAFCDSELPAQRQARFCPYCGADQRTRPCSACGEALEAGWVFCIACGATAQ